MKKIILCALICALTLPALAQEQEDIIVRRGQYKPAVTDTIHPEKKEPTKDFLRISAGLNIYGSIAYEYKISPSFIIGAGAGVTETWVGDYFDCEAFLPLFLETELRTPNHIWSLFLNLKVGTTIISFGYWEATNKVFVSLMAGFSYKNLSLGGGISTMNNEFFGNIVLSISYDLPFTTLKKLFF